MNIPGDMKHVNGFGATLPEMPDAKELEQVMTTQISGADLPKVLGGKSVNDVREAPGDDGFELPQLDIPDVKIAVKVDVVRMTMILTIESDAEQAKNIQDIVKADQGNIKARNEQRMKKVGDSLKKMDDAAKASIFQKIFGWLMVAVAAIAAVAMSIASGGVALGPLIGAGLAVTFQALNEAKVTDKIIKAIADKIQQNHGTDAAQARMWATIIWTAVQLAASLAGGFGVDKLVSKAVDGINTTERVLRTAGEALKDLLGESWKTVATVTGGVSLSAGIGGTAWATAEGYASGTAQSAVTKFGALIQLLKARMEEDEDMLKQLMNLLDASPKRLLDLMTASVDAQKLISMNIGGEFA